MENRMSVPHSTPDQERAAQKRKDAAERADSIRGDSPKQDEARTAPPKDRKSGQKSKA